MRHPRTTHRRSLALTLALAAALAGCAPGAPGSDPDRTATADSTATDSTVYRPVEIRPDVFATVVRDGVDPSQWATSLIVVRSDHVLVVDTRQHAPAADELLATVARVTDLPVRYVVNTHWHGDHVQGNAAFRAAYPELRIIGGATVAEDMRALGRERLDGEIARGDAWIATARGWLESGQRDDGSPLTDEEKAALPDRIAATEAYVEARRGLELVPPDIAVDSALSLGDAEPRVEILEVGPAHTRGDVIVLLPERGIGAIGDLIEDGFPWFGDGYPAGWAAALDRIAALDLDVILPGHGPVLRDREMFDIQHRFARAVAEAARRAVETGLSLEEASAATDLQEFETHFTRHLADRPPEERHERYAAFVDETFARAYAEASGALAPDG